MKSLARASVAHRCGDFWQTHCVEQGSLLEQIVSDLEIESPSVARTARTGHLQKMNSFVIASLLVGSMLVTACGANPFEPKACTEMGCDQSAMVNFSFREPGTYVFEVTVDGVKTTCRETLPLSQSNPCDRSDVTLLRTGSALPPSEQSLDGLRLQSTAAKTVAVRATRDGALIGEKTIELAWTVRPGPNGPDCEPKECRSAVATFQ